MKCSNCNKKMGLVTMQCKCKGVFCLQCRLPEVHSCTFDHIGNEKITLAKKLNKVIAKKIEKI